MENFKQAKEKVIKCCQECGVNMSLEDFKATNTLVLKNNEKTEVSLFFLERIYGRNYKWKLTNSMIKSQQKFLQYPFCTVTPEFIRFTFTEEMLNESETSDSENIEKIIGKVNKLLALADPANNPSEGEAIAASVKAQQLLAKYNLTMADVRGTDSKESMEKLEICVALGRKWKYPLAARVAPAYCCKCWSCGNTIIFFGYKTDALLARRIYAYLFEVGDNLAKEEAKRIKEEYDVTKDIYNSFVAGFLKGVADELSKTATALALIVPEEVEDAYDEIAKGFKRSSDHRIKTIYKEPFENGIVEGRRALTEGYLDENKPAIEQ